MKAAAERQTAAKREREFSSFPSFSSFFFQLPKGCYGLTDFQADSKMNDRTISEIGRDVPKTRD
jgi:hypothetical protein